MESCTVPGCGRQVQKSGYTLCYEHWKEKKVLPSTPKPIISKPTVAQPSSTSALLSATKLSERLNLNRNKVNPLLAELGLLEKVENGWLVTEKGVALGAEQKFAADKSKPYVLWADSILSNQAFLTSIQKMDSNHLEAATESIASGFREKFLSEAKYHTDDGHKVRSKAEAMIDNWLYWSSVIHAYERRLPIEEEAYCDFFVRSEMGKRVYIEYWGFENNPKYTARKQEKQRLYEKYELNLIELVDDHVKCLDDHLPQMLRKYGVIVA